MLLAVFLFGVSWLAFSWKVSRRERPDPLFRLWYLAGTVLWIAQLGVQMKKSDAATVTQFPLSFPPTRLMPTTPAKCIAVWPVGDNDQLMQNVSGRPCVVCWFDLVLFATLKNLAVGALATLAKRRRIEACLTLLATALSLFGYGYLLFLETEFTHCDDAGTHHRTQTWGSWLWITEPLSLLLLVTMALCRRSTYAARRPFWTLLWSLLFVLDWLLWVSLWLAPSASVVVLTRWYSFQLVHPSIEWVVLCLGSFVLARAHPESSPTPKTNEEPPPSRVPAPALTANDTLQEETNRRTQWMHQQCPSSLPYFPPVEEWWWPSKPALPHVCPVAALLRVDRVGHESVVWHPDMFTSLYAYRIAPSTLTPADLVFFLSSLPEEEAPALAVPEFASVEMEELVSHESKRDDVRQGDCTVESKRDLARQGASTAASYRAQLLRLLYECATQKWDERVQERVRSFWAECPAPFLAWLSMGAECYLRLVQGVGASLLFRRRVYDYRLGAVAHMDPQPDLHREQTHATTSWWVGDARNASTPQGRGLGLAAVAHVLLCEVAEVPLPLAWFESFHDPAALEQHWRMQPRIARDKWTSLSFLHAFHVHAPLLACWSVPTRYPLDTLLGLALQEEPAPPHWFFFLLARFVWAVYETCRSPRPDNVDETPKSLVQSHLGRLEDRAQIQALFQSSIEGSFSLEPLLLHHPSFHLPWGLQVPPLPFFARSLHLSFFWQAAARRHDWYRAHDASHQNLDEELDAADLSKLVALVRTGPLPRTHPMCILQEETLQGVRCGCIPCLCMRLGDRPRAVHVVGLFLAWIHAHRQGTTPASFLLFHR